MPFLTMRQALDLLERGETSSVELTRAALERIEAVEDRVRAYVTVDPEGALAAAEAADRQRRQGEAGPLCGLPLSVKDVLCTRGLRTTCGSRMLENFVPPYDATVITRLRRAGAVLLGKTAMDEFAMGSTSETCAFGAPDNPWKAGHVCGGSSGGSAAAVAAGECLASLGSDTGGSIRQPASLCGIVGLKPTYGRVSRYGLVAFASSLDQVGPMTRDVEDCALLLEVIAGGDPLDSTCADEPVPACRAALGQDLGGLRVGVPAEYFGEGLDPEVEAAVRAGLDMLADAGAELKEISLPHTRYAVAVYYIIAPAEASSNLARYDGVRYTARAGGDGDLLEMYRATRSQAFGEEVKRRILIGTYALSAGYYDAYYGKASQVRALIRDDFLAAFEQCDLIASPVVPTPAWPKGEKQDDPLALYLSDALTLSANLAGIPGLSVPVGMSGEGLPIGMQLQGPHFREDLLLRAAWNVEQRAALAGRHPEP